MTQVHERRLQGRDITSSAAVERPRPRAALCMTATASGSSFSRSKPAERARSIGAAAAASIGRLAAADASELLPLRRTFCVHGSCARSFQASASVWRSHE